MDSKKENVTYKVVLGYLFIILIGAFTVLYIYNLVAKIAEENVPENIARQKVYLVTNILSLLFEGESYTQFTGMADDELENFNGTMDKVIDQMSSLRLLMTDSIQVQKLDTIEGLLAQKYQNTHLLYETWLETEKLYSRNIAKAIKAPNKSIEQVEVQTKEETKKETLVTQRKKRGFLKRLADVFVADTPVDTSFLVNSTSHIYSDSLVNSYNPADTIASVLKHLQKNMSEERMLLNKKLSARATDLRYNNSITTNKINQILLEIEEEEMNASLAQTAEKQEMLHQASKVIANIAIVSIIIVLIFLFFIVRDVLRSRYYRKQLEEAKKYAEDLLQSRERLMLTISHDIRAPLSSILGYIDLLMEYKPKEKNKLYLDSISTSSKHILLLVNDLLDFHRLDSGKMEIHSKPFKVASLFNEIFFSLKPVAEKKGLKLDLAIDEPDANQVYLGDSLRIHQAIGNLLSNAIKFTPKGCVSLKICVNPKNENERQLKVSVIDEGPGIPVSEQEKIFGEFTRLEGTKKQEGFGLGLSITSKLIALMGGEISLQSVYGEGCEFTVLLPLPLTDEELKTEPLDHVETPVAFTLFEGRKLNCLLVDDDLIQITLTEELLKRNNANVVCCTNSSMALDLLQKTSFDLVLTDIQMPELDGYNLLEQIRTSGILGADKLPVIALSASVSNTDEHYANVGFAGFLNKPFTAADFISLLNQLFAINLPAKKELNISSLLSFASGDRDKAATILNTFIAETEKNIELMQRLLAERNKVDAGKLAHKLLPLFSMLQANELEEDLRIIERNYSELSDTKWEQLVDKTIVGIKEVLKQIKAVEI